MNEKETIISRVFENKFGECIISFKFQLGDLSMQEKEDLKLLWRDGSSLKLNIERFQREDDVRHDVIRSGFVDVTAKSNCCNSTILVVGGAGDVTRYYECQGCQMPCNIKALNQHNDEIK